MKLKNKIMIITLLAMVSFIGLGFAAWTFTNTVETSVVPATDKVAVAVEMDETTGLKLYADSACTVEVTELFMICDAPTTAAAYLAGNGVYWSNLADGSNVLTTLYIKGALNYNEEDGVKPISKVVVEFTVTNTLTLDKYVTIGAVTAPANLEVTVAVNAPVQTSFALPTLTYTSDATGITDVAGVTTMNTYLGSHLTGGLKVSAHIISVIE